MTKYGKSMSRAALMSFIGLFSSLSPPIFILDNNHSLIALELIVGKEIHNQSRSSKFDGKFIFM